jgi:D-alanyl-D-alanine carboxypeptidase
MTLSARSAALVLALLLAAACAPAGPAPSAAIPSPSAVPALEPEAAARIDSIAEAALAGGSAPGISIAVARNGVPVHSRGYGLAEIGEGVPVEPSSVFRVGSVTKQFTAAAILRLEEQGRLSLDDEIVHHLPEFPTQGHRVTVRHLLNHTSGIRSYTSLGPRWALRMAEDLSPDEVVALFRDEPFDFAPGERYLYNNSGYFLLGMIIERVAGVPYAEYIDREFVRELGLDGTRYCPNEPDSGDAHGYAPGNGSGPIPAPSLSMTHPFAAGALCSTAEDLVRWSHALASGRVVSDETFRRMTTPATLPSGTPITYGYGLLVGRLDDTRRVSHGGGINGFASYLAEFPEHGLSVAVLANSHAAAPAAIAENVARAALGLEIPRVDDRALTAEDGARFVGTYDLGQLELRIYAEGDRLMSQATGQAPARLLWQGGDEFRAAFDPAVRIVFHVEDGRASRLTLYQGGATIEAPRLR